MIDAPVRTFLDAVSGSLPALGRVTPGTAASMGWLGSGYSPIHLAGLYTSAGATWETVWHPGGTYPWPTSDQTLRVSSSDANDDDGDAGAWSVRLWWLDSAGVETVEDIVLDGVNLVDSAYATARRLNKAEVLTCGATGYNEGTITIYASDGATVLGVIYSKGVLMTVGGGSLDGCIQTVPAGYRDIIQQFHANTAGSACYTRLLVRQSPTSPWIPRAYMLRKPQHNTQVDLPPLVIAAGSDYMAWAYGGAAGYQWAALTGWREPV